MKYLLVFLITLCSFSSLSSQELLIPTIGYQKLLLPTGKPIKVAVIDTGLNLNDRWPDNQLKICPGLSKDFTNTSLNDTHGHGTHIAGLISKYAENANYCLVIYKYYLNESSGLENLDRTIMALIAALKDKVDVINYSGGGILKNKIECDAIKLALDAGIKVNAAAGNESTNLSYFGYYPALCDPRINVVESVDRYGERAITSNYSISAEIKTFKEVGVKVYSTLPNGKYGYMSGTSQATAVFTGKLIKQMSLKLVK